MASSRVVPRRSSGNSQDAQPIGVGGSSGGSRGPAVLHARRGPAGRAPPHARHDRQGLARPTQGGASRRGPGKLGTGKAVIATRLLADIPRMFHEVEVR